MAHLTLVPSDGSAAPVRFKTTEALDRGVSDLHFSADGKSISFFVTDDRSVYPARAALVGGNVEKLMSPPVVAGSWSWEKDHVALLSSTDSMPNEVFAFEGGKLRQLTHQNDALFRGGKLLRQEKDACGGLNVQRPKQAMLRARILTLDVGRWTLGVGRWNASLF